MSNDQANLIIEVVLAFNEALNARDVEGMMAYVTPLTVFENTYPAPDGTRYEGYQSVKAFWEDFFSSSSSARIEVEEIFAADNRCAMRWTYHWTDQLGKSGRIRGVDLYRIEEGLIAEKLSYVKG